MIIDSLSNAHAYECMGARIAKGLNYLSETDFAKLKPGRYDVEGEEIYALVQHYDTKPFEEGLWEAHRLYLDLQYVAKGTEKMGYANVRAMKQVQEYNEMKDVLIYEGEGDFITCPSGTFTLLFPEDVHMPRIWTGTREPIIKAVLKILL